MQPSQTLDSEVHLLAYINEFIHRLGVSPVDVRLERLESARLVSESRDRLPLTFSKFAKAARFAVAFTMEAPIVTPFTQEAVGPLVRISNHQNAIVALALAFDALEVDGLGLGEDTYFRLVEALASASPYCEKLLAVLFEVLSRKA